MACTRNLMSKISLAIWKSNLWILFAHQNIRPLWSQMVCEYKITSLHKQLFSDHFVIFFDVLLICIRFTANCVFIIITDISTYLHIWMFTCVNARKNLLKFMKHNDTVFCWHMYLCFSSFAYMSKIVCNNIYTYYYHCVIDPFLRTRH